MELIKNDEVLANSRKKICGMRLEIESWEGK